jgi:hypothetical protein
MNRGQRTPRAGLLDARLREAAAGAQPQNDSPVCTGVRDASWRAQAGRRRVSANWLPVTSRAPHFFLQCEQAISEDVPIVRKSAQDKEFPAQNWVRDRLTNAGLGYVANGRNTYPDFLLLGDPPESFEVKSLAYPGRIPSFDANSQPPCGLHDGRTLFYIFVRYPKKGAGTFPVHDLVICHGDFIDPTRGYVHRNDNVPNFGAYGDVMIRDRKMYTPRTPHALADGLAGRRTLILPSGSDVPAGFQPVGTLERREADEIAVRYEFDLKQARLRTISERNPNAGKLHAFTAYRIQGGDPTPVSLTTRDTAPQTLSLPI